jgi:hypothetical protein
MRMNFTPNKQKLHSKLVDALAGATLAVIAPRHSPADGRGKVIQFVMFLTHRCGSVEAA